MTVYAESSAVLAGLLRQPGGSEALAVLEGADGVVASDLTIVECTRALRRLLPSNPAANAGLLARLEEFASAWNIEAVTPAVVDRARQPFPDDAIRTLDAIHLATAVVVRAAGVDLEVLSLDLRVRVNAMALGFRVLPA